jgi:hypothetical protein
VREELAERLLAKVLGWEPEQLAKERQVLQAMAALKYDEYQQYSPAVQFIGSLATWLHQFDESERDAAYQFVRQQLIFISAREMSHLAATAFPDYIRPALIRQAASEAGLDEWDVTAVLPSREYGELQRRSLFLGLSDGAHVDVFRRSNPELSHEQVWHAYDLASPKAEKMRAALASELGIASSADQATFRRLFLLDDFTGSGVSYLRPGDGDGPGGKLANISGLLHSDGVSEAFSADLHVDLVVYICGARAGAHLRRELPELPGRWGLIAIQSLPEDLELRVTSDGAMMRVAEAHCDRRMVNEHFEKGRHLRPWLGFDECALPLVLSHNCPNNSLALLWYSADSAKALFPRVDRHRSALEEP